LTSFLNPVLVLKMKKVLIGRHLLLSTLDPLLWSTLEEAKGASLRAMAYLMCEEMDLFHNSLFYGPHPRATHSQGEGIGEL